MTDTRMKALKALSEINSGGYSNLVLKKDLRDVEDKQDKAFITALVYGTVEKQTTLDYQLKRLINMGRTPVDVINVLRMGAYQLFYMDSVPAFAACDETVNLAKRLRLNHSLVNGVMRNLVRQGLLMPPVEKNDEIEYLSVKYSLPISLLNKWKKDYGMPVVRRLAGFSPKAYTPVRVNTAKVTEEEMTAALTKLGARAEKGILPGALRVSDLGAVNNIYYNGGYYTVQGEGAMLGAAAAVPTGGTKVLDVCAAPGGKSIYVAQAADCTVTAWDVHPHRVKLIEANARRMGVENIRAEVRDSLKYHPEYAGAFDSVIVDAPCSGLGTLWTKPEIRYRASKDDIFVLNGIQERILDNASRYVAPGGILVYCTCTLSKSENEDMVTGFLAVHDEFEPCEITGIPERIKRIQTNGMITLFPYLFGTEGFFVARMRRRDK